MSIHFSRTTLIYFNIALLSSIAMAFEIFLLRVFSIIQWHHFAYMVISLALLGYSAGGTMTAILKNFYTTAVLQKIYFKILFIAATAFALSMWLSVLATQGLDLNPQELLLYTSAWIKLITIYIILAVPFFFVSICIVLSFLCYPNVSGKIYAADLTGAGLGCALIFVLMTYFLPENILLILLILASIAAAVYLKTFTTISTTLSFVISIVLVSALANYFGAYHIEISQYKALAYAMRTHGAQLRTRLSGPLGEIRVVANNKVPFRHAPGLSLYSNAQIPEQLAIFVDGEGPSPIIHWDAKLDSLSYLKDMLSNAVYQLRPIESSYLVGMGGGTDILQAKVNGTKKLTVVELNPQIIELLGGIYPQFDGNILKTEGVVTVNSDARAYLESDSTNFDLIKLAGLSSQSASSAGLFALSENYLLTVEAMKLYLSHLTPNGMVSIDQWLNMPAKASLKLLTLTLKALKELNIAHPEKHLILLKSLQTSSLIVSKSPFQESEIDNLKKFCDAKGFDLVYPGNFTSSPMMQVTSIEPQQLFGPQAEKLIHDYKFDISPATDDKPYFNHYFKWSSLAELLRLKEQGGYTMLENGYLLLLAALVQTIVFGAILIILPFIGMHNRIQWNGSTIKILFYFSAIGLGFFFVEIAFIQKAILLFGHPVLAASIVIATFLFFSALGSATSTRESAKSISQSIIRLLLLLLLSSSVFSWLPNLSITGKIEIKYLLAILTIAPLAFYMGRPLPLAIEQLLAKNDKLVAWAWSVNGAASVMSSVLATLFAIQWGISQLIFIAGILYLSCILFFPKDKQI